MRPRKQDLGDFVSQHAPPIYNDWRSLMATHAAGRRAGVKDWVDSNFFDGTREPEKSYERTQRLDPQEFRAGVTVRELDFNLDTIPAELVDLFK
jgi:hypothetical protein